MPHVWNNSIIQKCRQLYRWSCTVTAIQTRDLCHPWLEKICDYVHSFSFMSIRDLFKSRGMKNSSIIIVHQLYCKFANLAFQKSWKKHQTWRYRSIKQEVRKHPSRKQQTHSQPHVIAACDWCVAKLLVTNGDSIHSISLLFWLSLSLYIPTVYNLRFI